MFFDSWFDLLRVLVVGTLGYLGLVLLLRISGKRTLAKLNAFDFLVTVALGSTLATVLLSSEVSLAEGVLAFALLIALQYAISWASIRSDIVQSLVKAEPTLLIYKGRCLTAAMRAQRVTRTELLAVLRVEGLARLEEAYAVVLETDGSFSVIGEEPRGPATALASTRLPVDPPEGDAT